MFQEQLDDGSNYSNNTLFEEKQKDVSFWYTIGIISMKMKQT